MEERSQDIGLTRRTLLGSLGVVGAGAAFGARGTTSFFSDEETFKGNVMVGGSLDLKVDWQEHLAESTPHGNEFAVAAENHGKADYLLPAVQPVKRLNEGTYPNGGGGIPLAIRSEAEPIALDFVGPGTTAENKDAFFESTCVEAYPDVDDDGIQEAFDGVYQVDGSGPSIRVGPACEDGADTPEDLDPAIAGSLRTANADTMGENGPQPVLCLQDVKPGDFGEITFSFHLCEDPGYVWLGGELVSNDERSVTEPEARDPDEDQTEEDPEDDFDGELAEHLMTRLWYDEDCDNQVESELGKLDMMLAVDTSGSIRGAERQQIRDGVNQFIEELPSDGTVKVGSLTFGAGGLANLQGLMNPEDISVALPDFGGNTPLPAGIDIADQALQADPNARPDAMDVVVVFSDGGPNYANTAYSAGGYTAPRDTTADWSAVAGDGVYDNADTASATVSKPEMDETALVAGSVRGRGSRIATVFVGEEGSQDAMTDDAIATYGTLPEYLAGSIATPGFSFTVDLPDLSSLADQLVEMIVVDEEVFFVGTLAQAVTYLESGDGIPLDGDRSTQFDEIEDPPDDEDRECFPAMSSHCIGLEWWLPVDHANQLQTDGVVLDLAFYGSLCEQPIQAEATAEE
jgi:hypothetical protein